MFLLGITPVGELSLLGVLVGLLCFAALAIWSKTGSEGERKD